jgi:predicted RNA binding protein YcfA (HicA-like mRNA interferase family)
VGKKLPVITFREARLALKRLGFSERRARGSHVTFFLKGGSHDFFTLPSHRGDLDVRIVRRLISKLEELGISEEDFLKAIRK